jgi:uncharacterized protein YbjT (DUF2867 family)
MAVGFRNETVCVLGGTGFVGRRIVSHLIRDGWRVVVPTRNRVRARPLLVLPGTDVVECDVSDGAQLGQVLRGSDTVINLIGILNEAGHDGSGFRRVHVDLVERIVRACQDAGVRKLLHMSALKASAERGPSHYLRTKGEGERVIATLCGDTLPYTIFQPAVIFGPGDTFINRFATLMRWLPMLALPRLDARFAPVYVDDVAAAFARAVTDAGTDFRTFQLCGPGIYSFREILQLTKKFANIHCGLLGLPDALGQAQAFLLERLVPGKPFSLDNFRSLSVANVCTDNGFAALDIEPRSLVSTLPTYLGSGIQEAQFASFREHAGR